MGLLRPASWPWLLAHELRLVWRSFGVRSRIIAAVAILFLALAHVAGYLMVRAHALDVLIARQPVSAIVMSVFMILLVISSAFGLAVRVLLERGDLELLMASPVPMTTIYAVRGLTVAVGSVASLAMLVLPYSDMGPFAGEWRALAGWAALAAVGLASAAIAFAVTLALVRCLGLRRARLAAQLVGAFIGIGFVFAMQMPSFLPRSLRAAVRSSLDGAAHDGWLSAESPLLWPLRAFAGDAVPLVGLMAASIAMFAWVVRATQGTLLRALQDSPAAASGPRRRESRDQRAFRQGLTRVVLTKELKLMRRDPALYTRALLPILYLVPLFVMSIRRPDMGAMFASALVVLAASIASALAWITVSGEEAPDLLGGAPVDVERIRWLKVSAALAPVVLLSLPFLAWFAYGSPRTAAIAGLFIALALASSAVVQLWSTPLGAGRDIRQRYRRNPFVSIADTLCSFAWAGGCYLALAGSPWLFAAMAVGCAAPVAAWASGRRGER